MNLWKVYAILVTVMFIWGFNLPAVKFLVGYIEPVTMTAFRILLASLTVFAILTVLKIVRKPTKKELPYILAGALLNVVGHHYFLSMGLTTTTSTSAGLILGTGPVLTAVIASLMLRIFPSKLQWIGVFLGLAGVSITVLSTGGETGGLSIGQLFVFLSILSQVFSYMIIAKLAKTLDPRLLTAYMFFVGSIILFLISLIQEPGEIAKFATVPPVFWVYFFGSGMIGTAVGHMLYNYSVGKAGPSKAAIFMNLNTVFVLLGSAILLGEIITTRHVFGLILIVAGVIFGSGAAEDLWKKRKVKRTMNALK
ncbi:DMT family transporter [Paenisporosarcina cavernae]|uniref:DMT family transporter n=1 Tax=Paenisporosarcina cavernae TaxID=2320858 RepID=A0A385YQ74_9BACL|nr:DMT family transporter [Paenisporosarcina cavernae]AYC28885.1 DMT family transporter [Paenisporosarcina cavernae]